MSESLAISRLEEERKLWRQNPLFGFIARPTKNDDNTLDLLNWNCAIPGKIGTSWEGGLYKINIAFPIDYPSMPPLCRFTVSMFHPNIDPCGNVHLSILDAKQDWKPFMSLKSILIGIQNMLDEPNISAPVQEQPYICYTNNRAIYEQIIKEQALKYQRK